VNFITIGIVAVAMVYLMITFTSIILLILALPAIVSGVMLGYMHFRSRRRMAFSYKFTQMEERAKLGDVAACYDLGMAYLRGSYETPKDPGTAHDWLLKAAERGDTRAMLALAEILRWGMANIRPDREGARTWEARAEQAQLPQ
jgi:TPR repeat protein